MGQEHMMSQLEAAAERLRLRQAEEASAKTLYLFAVSEMARAIRELNEARELRHRAEQDVARLASEHQTAQSA
jgi:hypothetical protein